MTEPLGGQQLLNVTSVSCSPLARDRVAVRIAGTWAGRHRLPLGRALLVVEAEGRRHRFPMIPEARGSRLERASSWQASFAMPAWLEPYLMRRGRLQLGAHTIDLPVGPAAPAGPPAAARQPPQPAARIQQLERSLATARQEPARLNAMLAKAQADLSTRNSQYERLQSAHSELRDELARRRSAGEHERTRREELESTISTMMDTIATLRVQLAEAVVTRDTALQEVAGLRDELTQLGAAVSAVRKEIGPDDVALSEAESLLAEARSASARITRRFRSSVPAGDDG